MLTSLLESASRTRPSRWRQNARVALGIARAAVDTDKLLAAHMTVTRRCNLRCDYCTEYDSVSPPVPTAVLRQRIDQIADLGAVLVVLTGGESLLHPDIAEVVAYANERGVTPALNTNGFLLSRKLIEDLNQAGLYAMQLSIDSLVPNAVTMKALKTLRPKLDLLAAHARFRVRTNTVLGAAAPEQALEVVRHVTALGFEGKCSLLRNPDGTLAVLDEHAKDIYEQIKRLEGRQLSILTEDFQDELLEQGTATWKCRAGARFFHVCEDGLVHLCTPRWGDGARPLSSYTVEDIRRQFSAPKACVARCPVAYAHQGSVLDRWRPQNDVPAAEPTSRVHLRVVA